MEPDPNLRRAIFCESCLSQDVCGCVEKSIRKKSLCFHCSLMFSPGSSLDKHEKSNHKKFRLCNFNDSDMRAAIMVVSINQKDREISAYIRHHLVSIVKDNVKIFTFSKLHFNPSDYKNDWKKLTLLIENHPWLMTRSKSHPIDIVLFLVCSDPSKLEEATMALSTFSLSTNTTNQLKIVILMSHLENDSAQILSKYKHFPTIEFNLYGSSLFKYFPHLVARWKKCTIAKIVRSAKPPINLCRFVDEISNFVFYASAIIKELMKSDYESFFNKLNSSRLESDYKQIFDQPARFLSSLIHDQQVNLEKKQRYYCCGLLVKDREGTDDGRKQNFCQIDPTHLKISNFVSLCPHCGQLFRSPSIEKHQFKSCNFMKRHFDPMKREMQSLIERKERNFSRCVIVAYDNQNDGRAKIFSRLLNASSGAMFVGLVCCGEESLSPSDQSCGEEVNQKKGIKEFWMNIVSKYPFEKIVVVFFLSDVPSFFDFASEIVPASVIHVHIELLQEDDSFFENWEIFFKVVPEKNSKLSVSGNRYNNSSIFFVKTFKDLLEQLTNRQDYFLLNYLSGYQPNQFQFATIDFSDDDDIDDE